MQIYNSNNSISGSSRAKITISTLISKIMGLVGYVVGIFFALIALVLLIDGDISGALILFFVFAFPFLLLAWQGRRIKKRIMRFRSYIHFISTQQTGSLHVIATQTNLPVEFVKTDIETMIRKRYFVNAYINHETMEICFAGKTSFPHSGMQQIGVVAATSSSSHTPFAPGQSVARLESFTCGGCGASGTKPQGGSAICEYCGTVTS